MILVDTNVVLRLTQPGHPHRVPALDAIALLATRDGEHFAIAPQSCYEMYVVCSRPAAQNGLGLTPAQALAEIAQARSLFHPLPEVESVYAIWEDLVARYNVIGKPAHDARLVAFMIAHGLRQVLTLNDADFERYAEVGALNPFDVLAIPRS